MSEIASKREAQRHVDRIHAFRQQLDDLLRQGVFEISQEQRQKLDSHFSQTLAALAEKFDVDVSESQKRISLGMHILSTLGGLALCAALVLFFFRLWGVLSTPAQVIILVSAPLLALAVMALVSGRDRARYYTALIGLVVIAAFYMNLAVLGSLFNMIPTPSIFLAGGAFALILAYTYRLRLLLFVGLVSVLIFGVCAITGWTGGFWVACILRPENFLLCSLPILAIAFSVRHKILVDFPEIYRTVGLVVLLLSLEFLVHSGQLSYLPLAGDTVEIIYRIAGFLAAGTVIWLGIRKGYPGIVNLGAAFFALYLFDRLFSWWWDWMPKYLFFLIIGSIAVVLLIAFRKLRNSMQQEALS